MTGEFTEADFVLDATGQMSAASLAEAFNASFEGYYVPVQHTTTGFAEFCRLNSLNIGRSVVMRHRDGRLAGLTMLGIRGWRGWCGGFGLVPAFRGQGLARLLMGGLVEQAQQLELHTLQLEVFTQNTPAIKTYQQAGFNSSRELVILSAPATQMLPELKTDAVARIEISEVEPEEGLRLLARLEPESGGEPCWQREEVALGQTHRLRSIVARRGRQTLAVLLYTYHPTSGNISIGNLTFYSERAAKALLERAAVNSKILRPKIETAKPEQFFILNEPSNTELFALLAELGLQETNRQIEMVLSV